MAIKEFDYRKARAELDELLAWFESGAVSVEDAIVKYERAEELLKQLESYLNDMQAKIVLLTKKTDTSNKE